MKATCPIRGVMCPEHGFVHGAEAEELRVAIERLISDEDTSRRMASRLQSLLDNIDARDALAWLDASMARRKRRAVKRIG